MPYFVPSIAGVELRQDQPAGGGDLVHARAGIGVFEACDDVGAGGAKRIFNCLGAETFARACSCFYLG